MRTIDAYAGGASLRLVVDGFPAPRGRTMAEKRAWVDRHAGDLRGALLREPRGHRDLTGAVLTEPVSPGSHAGVLFMRGAGAAPAVDHGLISLTTIALEHGLIVPGGDGNELVFDTVAGTVRVRARTRTREANGVVVTGVTCVMPPAFVVTGGHAIRAEGRTMPVDVAYGGACYAVVDSESAGVGLAGTHVAGLRRAGTAILEAVAEAVRFVHPADPGIRGVHGVIFTGPPADNRAALRAAVTFREGQIVASPAEAGLSVILAVLDAIGLVADEGAVAIEGLTGITWTARIAARTRVGEAEAIVPEVEGAAWLTGEHTCVIQPDDPFPAGLAHEAAS